MNLYLRRLQVYHCVQLNALFCCLWRNVESSSHKYFVVFSRSQHRRLLPAMCYNLRQDGGCGLPATVLTTILDVINNKKTFVVAVLNVGLCFIVIEFVHKYIND